MAPHTTHQHKSRPDGKLRQRCREGFMDEPPKTLQVLFGQTKGFPIFWRAGEEAPIQRQESLKAPGCLRSSREPQNWNSGVEKGDGRARKAHCNETAKHANATARERHGLCLRTTILPALWGERLVGTPQSSAYCRHTVGVQWEPNVGNTGHKGASVLSSLKSLSPPKKGTVPSSCSNLKAQLFPTGNVR